MNNNQDIFKIEELEERLEMTSMEALGDNVICWKPNDPKPETPKETPKEQ